MQKFCESEYWKKGRIVRGLIVKWRLNPHQKQVLHNRNQLLMRSVKKIIETLLP